MDNIISIELFKQVYKFKTDLDSGLSHQAVEILQNAVTKVQGGLAAAVPLGERQIILTMAALDLISEQIRLEQQYKELLEQVKSRSDSLVAKLSVELQAFG